MAAKYRKIIGITAISLGVCLGMKYLLPFAGPFVIAYLLVRILQPMARKLEKKLPFKKETISVGLLFLLVGLLSVGLWLLAGKLLEQVKGVIYNLDYYERSFQSFLTGCCDAAESTLGIDGEDMQQFIQQNITYIADRIQVYLVPGVFNNSIRWAVTLFKAFGVVCIIFIAVILMLRDYDAIRAKLEGFQGYQHLVRIVNRLWILGGAYLKAQGMIILIVILICVGGLWILGNPYALLVGILIGLLDALPFIGTGTVLLPWAFLCLIQGDFFYAASYATLFLIANTAREYLEPKLLGDKLGVYPIVIAVVVYVGLCIYGVAGVFLGPLTLLIIMEWVRELWQ